MPTVPLVRFSVAALMLAATLLAVPHVANAQQKCGQPVTTGANPTASDCLFILRAAVGSATCDPVCICNVDNNPVGGNPTATDALSCLKKAVGQDITLNCGEGCIVNGGECETRDEATGAIGCPAALNTCTSGRFVSVVGSDLDTGWNGLAHNQDLVEGAEITVALVRRCTGDPATECLVDSECGANGPCVPFCDCDDPANSVCDITGPTHERRCVRDLVECSQNADCGAGGRCERFFGPPLPLSAANTPACITTFFQEDISGTADAETGAGEATAFLRSRVHLGVTNDKPCPRCGAPNQNPQIGDQFTCDGGPNNGDPCTVEAVSPQFGGVSNACPPAITSSISGEGLAIRFLRVTTGTAEKTATLPCVANNVCTDDGSACETNADCSGLPVTCGYFCHCGFCNDDPAQPCFEDSECDAGETCNIGNSTTGMQDQPNGCTDLICGRDEPERCCAAGDANCPESAQTPLEGTCTLKKFISCSGNPSDPRFGQCERENGGTCQLNKRACFEHTISRTGEPSPLGSYCVDDPAVGACTSNADCGTGACVPDTSEPTTVALFCVPRTASAAINAAGGIPGPGAITFNSVIFACRCGDNVVGCDEQCDDGNNTNGDGCDQACRNEP